MPFPGDAAHGVEALIEPAGHALVVDLEKIRPAGLEKPVHRVEPAKGVCRMPISDDPSVLTLNGIGSEFPVRFSPGIDAEPVAGRRIPYSDADAVGVDRVGRVGKPIREKV